MDPLTMSLILSGAKMGFGAYQAAKGNKLGKQAVRPEAEIPSAVNEQLRIARAQALNTRLPGQSQIESNISGSTQTGLRAAQESGDLVAMMAMASAMAANQNKAYQDLGTDAARVQQQNIGALQNTLGQYGEEQKRLFDVNKMQPYLQKAQAAEALKGAGIQNIQSGLTDMGGSAMKAYTAKTNDELVNKILGKKKASDTNNMMLQSLGIDTTNMSPEEIMQASQMLGTIG